MYSASAVELTMAVRETPFHSHGSLGAKSDVESTVLPHGRLIERNGRRVFAKRCEGWARFPPNGAGGAQPDGYCILWCLTVSVARCRKAQARDYSDSPLRGTGGG